MRLPTGDKLRFLIAGAGNTLFGVADTFFCTWLLLHIRPGQPKLMATIAIVVSTIINITVSFFSYKLFVFRSKGKALPEYLRSLLVYLPSMAISAVLAAPLTGMFQHIAATAKFAPYAAQACIVAGSVVFSFIGHKYFTFKKGGAAPAVGAVELEE